MSLFRLESAANRRACPSHSKDIEWYKQVYTHFITPSRVQEHLHVLHAEVHGGAHTMRPRAGGEITTKNHILPYKKPPWCGEARVPG